MTKLWPSIEAKLIKGRYYLKEKNMKSKAVITHPRGKYRKQFRFVLVGENGEPLGQSEFYNNRKDLYETLKKYFPKFEIEDKTIS